MRSAVMLLAGGLMAAGIGLAPAALADPAALPAAVAPPLATALPPQPGNSVHCVFEQMPGEDREMAMLLMENEILADGDFTPGSRNLAVIERLIEEARIKCDNAFHWSKPRSDAAADYAMSALFTDGLSQTIAMIGQQTKPIDSYFAQHRVQLIGSRSVKGIAALHFKAYLVEQGWDEDDKDRLGIGVFYLETLIWQDGNERDFAAAPLHAAPVKTAAKFANKPATRASRAKTTRRGRT